MEKRRIAGTQCCCDLFKARYTVFLLRRATFSIISWRVLPVYLFGETVMSRNDWRDLGWQSCSGSADAEVTSN